MKTIFMTMQGMKHIYNYECTNCKKTFADKPIYFPAGKFCKYCPECGHEFKYSEIGDVNGKR